MCQINTLHTFRWRHFLVKPEKTYAYTWYKQPNSAGHRAVLRTKSENDK